MAMIVTSCSDEDELLVPHANNVTFSELEINERFSHVIPDGGFTASGMKFNTVKSGKQLSGGFCYSNRSNRSFVWNNDEVSMDSVRYSVWSTKPNQTGTYLVCHVNGDDAFFTLETPKVIDYVLVANTTWNYLCMYYGDSYGTTARPVANPNVPSAPKYSTAFAWSNTYKATIKRILFLFTRMITGIESRLGRTTKEFSYFHTGLCRTSRDRKRLYQLDLMP